MVSGTNFAVGVLSARALGPAEFGVFTLAWLVVLFAANLQYALISAPMMTIGPMQKDGDTAAYFGAIFAQQAGMAGLFFVAVFAGATASARVFPEWGIAGLALPLALATCAYQTQEFLRRYFFTRGRSTTALCIDAVSYLGQLAVLVWLFAVDELSPARALWAVAGAATLAAVIGALRSGRLVFHADRFFVVTRRQWQSARWLGAASLLSWSSTNLFLIAAGVLLGPAAVGALKAAQTLMGVMHVLFMGLDNFVPIEAGRRYHRDGIAALTRYIRRGAWMGTAATAAVAVLFAVVPEFWLRLFFGEEFAGNGGLLRWYAAVYLVMFLGFPVRAGLRALEHTRPFLVANVLATIVALSSVYPLLTWLGPTGTVVGLLIVQVIMQSVLMVRFVRRVLWLRQKNTPT